MTSTRTFREKLTAGLSSSNSIACMGLDPVAEALPSPELSINSRVLFFFRQIFEEMLRQEVLPGAFKPNIGFFHCLDRPLEKDFGGSLALQEILKLIREMFPEIPVILDMKRGDIARSSANYAEEAFSGWAADAVTISPYMGGDSVGPFIEQAVTSGGGVYILNRTSNPGAGELQNLTMADGEPLYIHVARCIRKWGRDYPAGSVGAVVGATSPEELRRLADFYAENPVPLLIPGVGGQGGSASETAAILKSAGYPPELVRINSSSSLTHPWVKKGEPVPADFARKVVENLRKLHKELNDAE